MIVQLTIEGDQVIVQKLMALPERIRGTVIDLGIKTVVSETYDRAFELLSGSGADAPGAYPVPIRTGNLRRLLDTVFPGGTRHGVRASKFEGYVLNAAEYAGRIHDGRGFITDGIVEGRFAGLLERLLGKATDEL